MGAYFCPYFSPDLPDPPCLEGPPVDGKGHPLPSGSGPPPCPRVPRPRPVALSAGLPPLLPPGTSPPPDRTRKRRWQNRRPEASQGVPPPPAGDPRDRRRRNRPVGAGPSFDVPDALSQLFGLSETERGLLQLVAPLLPLPSLPGRGDPPSGPEDAFMSGPPPEAPDPPSPNRRSPPPGREDASVDVPPPETLGSASQVDSSRPPEAMETSAAGDPPPPWGLPPPCPSLRKSWWESTPTCIWTAVSPGSTGSDAGGGRCQICDNIVHLTGVEPPLRLHAVIANFCDERQWPEADVAVLDPGVYHTISLHPRAAGLVNVRDRLLGAGPRDCTQCVRQAVGLQAVLSLTHGTGLPLVIHCRAGVDNDSLVAHRQ